MNALLRLERVQKRFGGLTVLSDITLEVKHGERHAVIGPNGAGKSTLFNLISGRMRPSAGRILFGTTDIGRLTPHAIARLGIGRSFQIINVFPGLSVNDCIRGAVVSKLGYRWHIRSDGTALADVNRATEVVLARIGLAERRNDLASSLPYGEQRKLEIALAMALEPDLILLDEPCAGLNAEDTQTAIALIKRSTEGRTLLIVEHDMDVVFGLADRISVIYYGQVLATGTPAEIRANPDVQQAYLGRKSHAAAR